MKIKAILAVIIIIPIVFILFLWGNRFLYDALPWGNSTIVKDVTKEEDILLSTSVKGHKVHGISVLVTGYIDGDATVQQGYSNKRDFYVYHIHKGKVRKALGGDWYDNKCFIKYMPVNVKSGKICIKYKFRHF